MSKLLLALPFVVMLFAACTGNKRELTSAEPVVVEYADSNEYVNFKFMVDLPSGSDEVSMAVRDSLIDVVKTQMSLLSMDEGNTMVSPFTGDKSDAKAVVTYYCRETCKLLTGRAKATAEDMGDNTMLWGYDLYIRKIESNERYVVYLSQGYLFEGGAHGTFVGAGPLTFSMKDGRKIINFIDESALDKMQPLIIEGLRSYFASNGENISAEEVKEHLMIDGNTIPLPTYKPYPNTKGLTFMYQDYEIASHAVGMPIFTIEYDKLTPFLTQEAKELLGL